MPFQTYKYKRDRVVCNMIFILINICTWKEIKKSPNHKITKSRNQEILDTQLQKGQSRMQYDLHIDQHFHLKRNQEIKIHSILYPLIHSSFPITFRPIWNFHHWWSNRERRTLNMARSTASLPLLVDFHTAFIIPFPSIMSRISPSEYNLNNHSNTSSMTFTEAESRASRRGYRRRGCRMNPHWMLIIPTPASSNLDPMNLRGFRSFQAQIYNLNQTAPTLR